MEVDEGPISIVAVDSRTGRDVGAVRPITSVAGDLVSDPSGMRYVGLLRYDRARKNLDRHPNYILSAYMASGS